MVNVLIHSLQVMLLGSSFQLPPPALEVPSPSDVLWMEVGQPFGEWVVVAIFVPWHISQRPLKIVAQAKGMMLSQPLLGLGLEQVLLPSHQRWVQLKLLHLMVNWLSALGPVLP